MWLTVVLLGGAVVLSVAVYLRRTPPSKGIPVIPGAKPIVGHLPLFAAAMKSGTLSLMHISNMRKYGRTIAMQTIRGHVYATSDYNLAREFMSDLDTFGIALSTKPIFQALGPMGLLALEGETWKRHRKLIQPFFGAKMLGYVHTVTVSQADALFTRWHTANSQQPTFDVDMLGGLKELTLAAIGLLAYSLPPSQLHNHHDAVLNVFRLLATRTTNPFPPRLWRFFYSDQAELDESLATVRREVRRIVQRRLEEGQGEKGTDVIGAMLATRQDEAQTGVQGLSDDEILDESLNLYLAGHETTSNGLFWCMFCLATNPTEQDRLREEVLKVSGSQSPTYEDIPKMTYLDGFIRECLRLHPPAPIVSRLAVKDVQVGPYTVHAGNDVLINIYGAQTDLRYWKDPKKLDPERWQNPEEGKGAYLPFGHGHKMCLGWRVAMTEMLCFVARLVQSYTVSLSEEQARLVVPFQTFTVTCFNPVHFTLVPVVKGQGVAPTTMSSGV